ncbi:MAG: hypothetical protein IPL67_07980 [Ignavibacteria bacterium]|nr:hypothetical protein [Ignavibacteria bacterium]
MIPSKEMATGFLNSNAWSIANGTNNNALMTIYLEIVFVPLYRGFPESLEVSSRMLNSRNILAGVIPGALLSRNNSSKQRML